MLEKYVQMKMIFEYKLPLILFGIIVSIVIISVIVAKIMDAWEKRQKKYYDKHFPKEEGDKDESN